MHVLVNRLLEPSRIRGQVFPGKKLPLEYLLKNVRHQEIEIRIAAAKGLRHFGHWDELEKLLRDPDPRLRRAALDGMLDWTGFFHMGKKRMTAQQYTPGILSALRDILANPDEAWWVVDGALFAMNAAPAAEVEHNLPAMLRWSESKEICLRMATFLGLLGAESDPELFKKALPTLTRMLADPSLPNREWMNGLMADALKRNIANPEVAHMIEEGFERAIQKTTVLPDDGLYRRQAEGLHIIKHTAMALMQQSPEAALPLAMVMAERLEEMTPEMLINIVSTSGVDVGPKSRLGLYAMVARQKDAQQKQKLIELLDTAYRDRLIETLDATAPDDRFRPNLIESIADTSNGCSNSSRSRPAPNQPRWSSATTKATKSS